MHDTDVKLRFIAVLNYLELVEVCLLRGCEEAELEFLVLGPSVMEGVALTSSVDRQKNSSSSS